MDSNSNYVCRCRFVTLFDSMEFRLANDDGYMDGAQQPQSRLTKPP